MFFDKDSFVFLCSITGGDGGMKRKNSFTESLIACALVCLSFSFFFTNL